MGGYAALIIILINTHHEEVATIDNSTDSHTWRQK